MSESQLERIGELEINQDIDFQQRTWAVQRVGWGVIGVIVGAALLGVFGSGLLSRTIVRNPHSPFALEYSRFARSLAPSTLEVQIDPGAVHSDTVRVWFTTAYLQGVQIEHILPQPERVEAGAERIVYVFRLAEPGQPTVVRFHLQQQQIGSLAGQVGLENAPPLFFSQFVYP